MYKYETKPLRQFVNKDIAKHCSVIPGIKAVHVSHYVACIQVGSQNFSGAKQKYGS